MIGPAREEDDLILFFAKRSPQRLALPGPMRGRVFLGRGTRADALVASSRLSLLIAFSGVSRICAPWYRSRFLEQQFGSLIWRWQATDSGMILIKTLRGSTLPIGWHRSEVTDVFLSIFLHLRLCAQHFWNTAGDGLHWLAEGENAALDIPGAYITNTAWRACPRVRT